MSSKTNIRNIKKVLIANRGEIARRVIRTCKKLGIQTVAVHSTKDLHSPFVKEADEAICIGDPEPTKSYLIIDRIIQAGKQSNADAIHPGYGFLSENAAFAKACQDNSIIFIGPTPHSIEVMGSKIGAKNLLNEHDKSIPLIPGYNGKDQREEVLIEHALRIGFPVLIKASAGGGGKGMRIVRQESELKDAIDSAKTESKNSFGDDSLLIEKYFDTVRHIEFQIFGDQQGNVIHIYERECSIQRRYQKVIEETPSPFISQELRDRMGKAAVSIGKAIQYQGAGTVEFIVDNHGDFYFSEVNTRLQVEHPITEAITCLDLVDLQIQVASGVSFVELGLVSSENVPIPIPRKGHAIECRLYAEDPVEFLPCTGKVISWIPAPIEGVRYDSGIESGSEVSIYYDPLISKIIAYGNTREIAIQKLDQALAKTVVCGVRTNKVFLQQILRHPKFFEGETTTHFIQHYFNPVEFRQLLAKTEDCVPIAAFLWGWLVRQRSKTIYKHIPSGFRNNPYTSQRQVFVNGEDTRVAQSFTVDYKIVEQTEQDVLFDASLNKNSYRVSLLQSESSLESHHLVCTINDVRRAFHVVSLEEQPNGLSKFFVHCDSLVISDNEIWKLPRLPLPTSSDSLDSDYTAPMPGKILRMLVQSGQEVKVGQPLLVMESMKMESKVHAKKDGRVTILVREGDLVQGGTVLLTVA